MNRDWREPTNEDTGKAVLVFSEYLRDDDYNTECIELGVVVQSDEDADGYLAICTQWCNYQDHWHTVELNSDFLVRDVPTYTKQLT